MKKQELGRLGEALARNFLIEKGYKLLAKNYRLGHFEVDLIFEHGRNLIAVEVKTRKDKRSIAPIFRSLQYRRIQSCMNYYAQSKGLDKDIRIDLIKVEISSVDKPVIKHWMGL